MGVESVRLTPCGPAAAAAPACLQACSRAAPHCSRLPRRAGLRSQAQPRRAQVSGDRAAHGTNAEQGGTDVRLSAGGVPPASCCLASPRPVAPAPGHPPCPAPAVRCRRPCEAASPMRRCAMWWMDWDRVCSVHSFAIGLGSGQFSSWTFGLKWLKFLVGGP